MNLCSLCSPRICESTKVSQRYPSVIQKEGKFIEERSSYILLLSQRKQMFVIQNSPVYGRIFELPTNRGDDDAQDLSTGVSIHRPAR